MQKQNQPSDSFLFSLCDTDKYEKLRHIIRSDLDLLEQALELQLSQPKDSLNTFLDNMLEKLQEIQAEYDPNGIYSIQEEYSCKFCNKKFTKPTALGGHISKLHKQTKLNQKHTQTLRLDQMEEQIANKQQDFKLAQERSAHVTLTNKNNNVPKKKLKIKKETNQKKQQSLKKTKIIRKSSRLDKKAKQKKLKSKQKKSTYLK